MSRSNEYICAYQTALNPDYFKRKHFKNLLPVSKTRRVVLLTNEDITNLKLLSKILNSKYQGKLTNSRVIRLLLKKVIDDLGLPNNTNKIGE
tara:strand:- start:212 stop:487 length:276 start_codon:yes stop_codon:yes gene_type:complete